jgi:hypothetical protein
MMEKYLNGTVAREALEKKMFEGDLINKPKPIERKK